MATIILGVVGGAVGSAFGGPGGAKLGWAIGTTIGNVIEVLSQPGVNSEIGRLSDLRLSGSSYGVSIPQVWGRMRLGGNVIWATDLKEHSETESQGGGKGMGPKVTTTRYFYTCSVAVAIAKGTHYLADGTLVNRNLRVRRIWADDLIVWDAYEETNEGGGDTGEYDCTTVPGIVDANGITLQQYMASDPMMQMMYKHRCESKNLSIKAEDKTPLTIRFYDGSEEQLPDPLMESIEGFGNTPAYRGTAYFVIEDMELSDFGNRIPNFSIEVESDIITVSSIVNDICGQVGIDSELLDLTETDDHIITGYVINNRITAQDALNPLLQVSFVDVSETDGKLYTRTRGRESTLTIPTDDLGAFMSGSESMGLEHIRQQEIELPGRVDVSYFNIDRDLEQATQGDVRQWADVTNAISINLPMALTDDEARIIAARFMDSAWLERDSYITSVPIRYVNLVPTDTVILPTRTGSIKARITNIELSVNGEIRLTMLPDTDSIMIQSVPGASTLPSTGSTSTGIIITPVPTDFIAWSGSELREEDQYLPGFYVAASGPQEWQGCTVYYSTDNGVSWVYGGIITARSIFGETVTALPDHVDGWDMTNVLGVSIIRGTLNSTPQSIVETGQNIAVVGNEILGFANANVTGDGTYNLSTLLRRLRGTLGSGHVVGERFVHATSALMRVTVNDNLVGQTIYVKCVSRYQSVSDVDPIPVIIGSRTPTKIEEKIEDRTLKMRRFTATAGDIVTVTLEPPCSNGESLVVMTRGFLVDPINLTLSNGGSTLQIDLTVDPFQGGENVVTWYQ